MRLDSRLLQHLVLVIVLLSSFLPVSESAQGVEFSIATDTIPAAQMKHRRMHRPPKKDKRAAQPAPRIFLTDEQAMHAFERDLSRNVGKQTQETDYPEEARRWVWTGTTLVQVIIGTDGTMNHVSVSKTSGFRVLDEQAVKMVQRVAVPPVPPRLRGREITVTVPIGFYLGPT
jgi:TonB family protein